ncbi:MAG: hypothetical protein Q4B87_00740 [Candidatus Saccharibacteria bacterium]|nr:hypothetical protein [Candidatus Saccharibacteria bacterium]
MFLLFGSFIVGMIVSLLTVYLSFRYLDIEEDSLRDKIMVIVRAAVFFFVPILANYLPTRPRTPVGVAIFLGIVIVALMIYMVYWWNKEGSSVKELIATIVIDIFLAIIGNTSFARFYDLDIPRGVLGVIMALPMMLMVLSVGYCVANMIWWYTIERVRIKKEGTVGTTTPIFDAIRRKISREETEEGGEEDESFEEEFDEFNQRI